MSTFRFLHAADLHLDSPLRGLAQYDGAPVELLRGATRRALERLVQRAIDERVAFVVIAGDVYDGDWRDFNTGLFLVHQLGRLREAGIRVYLVAGNHDAESQLTKSLRLPDNTFVFGARKAETFRDATGAALHGRSFREAKTVENLASGYPVPVAGAFNIGVLHTALEGYAEHARYAPCSVEELRAKGYDYWALGHVHEFDVLSRDPYIVFPGNLQGRHARETGPRGAVLVSVENGHVSAFERLSLDVVRWLHVRVDVSGATDLVSVEDRVREALEDAVRAQSDGRAQAVRVTLRGETAAHGAMRARERDLVAQVRALGNGLGFAHATWIEKILVETKSPGEASRAAHDDASEVEAADLRALLAEVASDPELLEKVKSELQPLLGRLPGDPRLPEEESGVIASLRRGEIAGLLGDAVPLLLERVEGKAGAASRTKGA